MLLHLYLPNLDPLSYLQLWSVYNTPHWKKWRHLCKILNILLSFSRRTLRSVPMSERSNRSSEILISDAVADRNNALHERTNQTRVAGLFQGGLQHWFLQVTYYLVIERFITEISNRYTNTSSYNKNCQQVFQLV